MSTPKPPDWTQEEWDKYKATGEMPKKDINAPNPKTSVAGTPITEKNPTYNKDLYGGWPPNEYGSGSKGIDPKTGLNSAGMTKAEAWAKYNADEAARKEHERKLKEDPDYAMKQKYGLSDPRKPGGGVLGAFKTGTPEWSRKEVEDMYRRTGNSRGHQLSATYLRDLQSKESPAAQRLAAYKLSQAGQQASAATGDPAASRAALTGFQGAGGKIASEGMAASADERRNALAQTAAARDMYFGSRTGAEQEAVALNALGAQDKWNRADNVVRYEQEKFKREQQRKALDDAIKAGDWDLFMKILDAGGTAVGAAGTIYNSATSDSSTSGYDKSQPSDKRVKKNVKEGGDAIKIMLTTIAPYEYEYNDKAPESHRNSGKHVGVMAQDLEKSELGKTFVNEEKGVKMVNYGRMMPTMLAALARQQDRLDKLEKENK